MQNHWNSESDIVARIREVRHIMELLTNEEMRLLNDLSGIRSKGDNWRVDDKGKVFALEAKPKPVKQKVAKVEKVKVPYMRKGKPAWAR